MGKIFCFIVVISLLPCMLFAGTTGKISGKVLDAESGTPLPGVNIILEGTTLGAASDLQGNYIILMWISNAFF